MEQIQPAIKGMGDWFEYPASVQPRANPAFSDTWVTGATGGARMVVPQGIDAFRTPAVQGCGACSGGGGLSGGIAAVAPVFAGLVGVAAILFLASLTERGPGAMSGRRRRNAKMPRVTAYIDNSMGWDKYTVVVQDRGWGNPGRKAMWGLSGWTEEGIEGPHLGKKIAFGKLPKHVQQMFREQIKKA